MSNVIPFEYKGKPVQFSTEGWINATEVAKRFGKRPAHWLELPGTQGYMAALSRHLSSSVDAGKSDIKLVETSKVRGKAGTWIHPKLAVAFARWLDDDFAVWCDLKIDEVIHGYLNPRHQYELACQALIDRKDLASEQGRGLSSWRKEKPVLINAVNYWRDQMQMRFPFEPTQKLTQEARA